MSTKKIALITGGNGYVGRVFSEFLKRSNRYDVVLTSKTASAKNPNLIPTDLTDLSATKALIEKVRPDIIFHLAGGARSRTWSGLLQDNILTTTSLIESIQSSKRPCRLVCTGSAAEYGNAFTPGVPLKEAGPFSPISSYGTIKVWQTELCSYYANRGSDIVNGRVFNLMGPGIPRDTVVGNFITQIKAVEAGKQEKISTSNLEPLRDYIDIRDACEALELIGRSGKSGETYNVCSGHAIQLRKLLGLFIEKSGLKSAVQIDESAIQHPLGYISESRGDPSKMKNELGWTPQITLEESVKASLSCENPY